MKVYIVAEDTYTQSYGAEIELFGVYTTKEQAEEVLNRCRIAKTDRK